MTPRDQALLPVAASPRHVAYAQGEDALLVDRTLKAIERSQRLLTQTKKQLNTLLPIHEEAAGRTDS